MDIRLFIQKIYCLKLKRRRGIDLIKIEHSLDLEKLIIKVKAYNCHDEGGILAICGYDMNSNWDTMYYALIKKVSRRLSKLKWSRCIICNINKNVADMSLHSSGFFTIPATYRCFECEEKE